MGFDTTTQYLTVKDIASLLKISELTVYKYIRSAKLEAIQLGGHFRVSVEALHVFLKKQTLKKGRLDA